MKVIAVVGTASGSGKTRLACAILRAVPGLGAVKVSPREGEPRVEWGAGDPGKDTARFTRSGAAAVARIVGPRGRVAQTWEGIRTSFAGLPGVLIEGAGALACAEERFTVFVVDQGALDERGERDERLAAAADWIVVVSSAPDPAMSTHPLLVRHGRRIPVCHVSAVEEDGLNDALLGAIREFLGGQEDARTSRSLAPTQRERVNGRSS